MPSEARFGVQTAFRQESQKLKAAGIYREKQQSFHRHSHESGNPDSSARKLSGENGFFRFYVPDSRLRGNDEISKLWRYRKKRNSKPQEFIGKNTVIPTKVGIQTFQCGNLSGKTVSSDFTF
ncbi:hypothetical protein [Neisseria lactamica]|uniref:hypothetical protein n=1 Tax=Neisseria lactamica TaxID=486 RepID=UPI00031E316A|nr:hypothetical protein [Neisseria lactamica]